MGYRATINLSNRAIVKNVAIVPDKTVNANVGRVVKEPTSGGTIPAIASLVASPISGVVVGNATIEEA